METSYRIYEDLINILEYIVYTYLYISSTLWPIFNLLSGA